MTLRIIPVRKFADARGWFSETYNADRYADYGIIQPFLQDNLSFSKDKGTLRGLHFQHPPFGQAKLVQCTRGAVWDVAVDIRKGSPTYGQWRGVELDADRGEQFFIPEGFLHGFVTLTEDVAFSYKVTSVYAPQCDAGVLWSDPAIGIDWPLPPTGPILSDKDAGLPLLSDVVSAFPYDDQPLDLIRF